MIGLKVRRRPEQGGASLAAIREVDYALVICAGHDDCSPSWSARRRTTCCIALNDQIRTVSAGPLPPNLVYLKLSKQTYRKKGWYRDRPLAGRARPPLDAIHPVVSAYADDPVHGHRARPTVVTSSTASDRRYMEGLSGLVVVQAGHGRNELAEAAAEAGRDLAYLPNVVLTPKRGGRTAVRLASLAHGRPSTGSSSPPAGSRRWWRADGKLALSYFRRVGSRRKHKRFCPGHIALQSTVHGRAVHLPGCRTIKPGLEPLVRRSTARVPHQITTAGRRVGDPARGVRGLGRPDRITEPHRVRGPDPGFFFPPASTWSRCRTRRMIPAAPGLFPGSTARSAHRVTTCCWYRTR